MPDDAAPHAPAEIKSQTAPGAPASHSFACSICGEASTQICAWCTKDACDDHLCEKCRRCSDCCRCEEPLAASDHHA